MSAKRTPLQKDSDFATIRQAKSFAGHVAKAAMAETGEIRDRITDLALRVDLCEDAGRNRLEDSLSRDDALDERIASLHARVAAVESYARASLWQRAKIRWFRWWFGPDADDLGAAR